MRHIADSSNSLVAFKQVLESILGHQYFVTAIVRKEDDKLNSPAARPAKPARRELLMSEEGRILLLGIAIAFGGIVLMGLVALTSPESSRMMGAMSIANVLLGTIVSMSIGYAAGYGHELVIPVNIWVETVMVLLFYPVFVFSMKKLVAFPKLKRLLERTHAAAERQHDKVRRYGVAGLFLFVWFPFWMTGPLVGCVIGYLLGFPAWLTLSVVLSGTVAAMFGWAYLLRHLYARAADFGSWAPLLIIGIIIFFVLLGYFLNRKERIGKASK